ncbi:MAG: preprotein translocase subunit SecY [Dictyoglomus sp.]|nr:preprotein translocase subunit SecY [Dictyoglomus sp.]MCX7941843.1 preprotein translocase subunit SecY [Dictyoglomaceae bacterium]MDW8188055.1 preprotein translocase subunit SecY [Dictyoglomus sp.]
MFDTLIRAFKLPDLRKKILFTLFIFAVYRFGAHIPVPGVDRVALSNLFKSQGLLGFLDLFTGGALARFSIFAMGITPYINASIMMELLTVVFPSLGALKKEEDGRRKLTRYARNLTVLLAAIEAFGLTIFMHNYKVIPQLTPIYVLTTVITLTAGTTFIMWLGEQISQYGIGNGVSLLILASILARFPTDVARTFLLLQRGEIGILNVIVFFILLIAIIVGVVWEESAERRIPVQYSRRVVGRRVYGGQSTYLPLKLNQAGVIPIIFAITILMIPPTIGQFANIPWLKNILNIFSPNSFLYPIFYFLLVLGFTYFYASIVFDPSELSENFKKYGGFIPGVRPGKPTEEYLANTLNRLNFFGGVFLGLIALIPTFIERLTGVTEFQLGGTSILIMVGVILDTIKTLEAQMIMKSYEGFLK